jgi:hypothetical protein
MEPECASCEATADVFKESLDKMKAKELKLNPEATEA